MDIAARLASILLLAAAVASSVSAIDQPPRMTVDADGHVRLPDGSIFHARGVNWGKRSIRPDGTTIYNASDATMAKTLLPGINHVRVVLDYYDPSGVCATDIYDPSAADTGFIAPQWLAFIDNAVQWTYDAGLWITITTRDNFGTASPHGQSTNAVACDADYIGNQTARQLWFQTWKFIARRYRNASNIAWLEPQSEPHLSHGTAATGFAPCHNTSQITALFNEVVREIREADPDTPIAVGPMGYSACPGLGVADKLEGDNLVYNMNWPCHLGKATASYGANVSCAAMGKTLTPCIPACANGGTSVKYDDSLVAMLMAPTLAFQQKHRVPLWLDQVMCAPRTEHGAATWLADSFAAIHAAQAKAAGDAALGFHFDFWTWKGDEADDDNSMSVLVYPPEAKEGKFDLGAYVADKDVLDLYRTVF